MTDDQLTLIATRIMDRVEKDGNGLQLTALIEELRAGLAIVAGRNDGRQRPPPKQLHNQPIPPNAPEGTVTFIGDSLFWFKNGKWMNVANGTWLKVE